MNENEAADYEQPEFGPPRKPFMNSVIFKVMGIGLLALLLLIPLSMVGATLDERQDRRNAAVSEITASWGKKQTITGPVLVIPYKVTRKTFKDTVVKGEIKKTEVLETEIARAWFLPDQLDVAGDIDTEKLHRGIYDAVVYKGDVKLTGRFSNPDFAALKVNNNQVMWEDAEIAVGVADLRGTGEALHLGVGGKSFRMSPGTPLEGIDGGVRSRIGGLSKSLSGKPFSLDISLNGSDSIKFAPLGIQNKVKLASAWPDPSFVGEFLPADRSVTTKGFNADWKVSYYGRSYPQAATGAFPADLVRSSLFGVSFFTAVDSYRKVERAIKYGILFLVLVFAAFFLFETLVGLKIHVIQYLLVGAALCLFFLGLLSVSEFLSFGLAYLLAAAAATLMITLYSWSILGSGKLTLVIAGELAAIYSFLYVSLQLQDYSLLLGTIGLVSVLAVIMYATRNLDWHALDRRGAGVESEA